jgi:Icc-related predicted phosphoesterase
MPITIDCISDLHGEVPNLEGGDMLIVSGDLTAYDKHHQYEEFFQWLWEQNYTKKILIGGNHDVRLEDYMKSGNHLDTEVVYLKDSGIEWCGYKFWGAPWTKNFIGQNFQCMAYGLHYDSQMKERWDKIPLDTQILITHGPARGVLDSTRNRKRVGCVELANTIVKLPDLKLHVFGHIHEGYGQIRSEQGLLSVNASIMNADYECVNKPIRVIL